MPAPADFPKDRISLCMIVKNEAERLGRCLASAKPWVGEMVVVDTGSTDDTVAIAASYGAKVVPFTWVDDFSAARNASLEAARNPWALVLDGDEELVVDDPAAFARAVASPAAPAYRLRLTNVDAAGERSSAWLARLFDRTAPGMRYRGAVHEQLAALHEGRLASAELHGAAIRHHGYAAEAVAAGGKRERNLRLARAHAAAHPDDPHAWYVLGMEAQDEGDEGLAALERALAMLAARPDAGAGQAWVAHAHILRVRARWRAGDPAGATANADEGLAAFAASPDLRQLRGGLRLLAGAWDGAEADYRASIAPEARAFPVAFGDPATFEIGAWHGIANAAALRGDAATAADAYARAADLTPATAPARGATAVTGVLRFLLRGGPTPGPCTPTVVAEAVRWFAAALAAGRFDEVEGAIGRAPALGEAWPALRRGWGIALAEAGFDDVALHLLIATIQAAPGDADALYWAGHAAAALGHPHDARNLWEACLQAAPGHARAHAGLAALAPGT